MAKKRNSTKKNAAKKPPSKNRILPTEGAVVEAAPPGGGMYALRETIESIVIAFVLAFLFRTFEAEAFVIPTGSMSPALQGQHKDVDCTECGYRFRTTASSEGEDHRRMRHDPRTLEVVLGVCPMCRQTMAMRPDLPTGKPPFINLTEIEKQTSYPGDRILVNKYSYQNHDPERWDVVVFKFPGNGEMNYIKRLVGLPDETLQIYQGDIFIRGNAATSDEESSRKANFQIERKPADKVLTMLQSVHDTDYEPSTLYNAGWPLRWQADGDDHWQVDAKAGEQAVALSYHILPKTDADKPSTAWLRYHHYLPQNQDWNVARRFAESGKHVGLSKEQWTSEIRPELISDFNPYNAHVLRGQLQRGSWLLDSSQLGVEWVSDLALRCELDVKKTAGAVLLDLVEAGRHFTCRIDLSSGEASLSIEGADEYQPTAMTPLKKVGSYELLFANIDDQLLLWVDGSLINFQDTIYSEAEIGSREDLLPRTSPSDLGDLAPAGVGSEGAELSISRLEVLRDIYYIAVDQHDPKIHSQWSGQVYFTDYLAPDDTKTLENGTHLQILNQPHDLFRDPSTWARFSTRRQRIFPIKNDQLFVMGDNSPASQDCRLWASANQDSSHPGGSYLDRRLLIGKAVCVFWPHSWGGISVLPGFPNFRDMRLVR